MRLIDRGEYFVVTADDAAGVMRFERTAVAFPSLEAVEETFERLLRLVQASDLGGFALLVDSRAAPGRNDEAFERILARYRDALFTPFTRCAMLLRTHAGIMQSQRLSREHKVHVQVFQDEALALHYLREGR
jgi:hypothetical protein